MNQGIKVWLTQLTVDISAQIHFPLVNDLAHDQGNIATFRTHITFEFQRTHIEFAWRSTFTYMFLLLAQISNFNLMLYFSQITFSHEKLRIFLPFYEIFEVFNENFSLSHNKRKEGDRDF